MKKLQIEIAKFGGKDKKSKKVSKLLKEKSEVNKKEEEVEENY